MLQEVFVASQNPVKLAASEQGFGRMFPGASFVFHTCSVQSGVSAQPMSREETLQGAMNRAQAATAVASDSGFAIGIEGGVEWVDGHLEVFAWVVVLREGRMGRAQTGVFILPDEVARLVDSGVELGHADDLVFQQNNSKQNAGSIGLLTDNALTRTSYYVPAVVMALIPFKKPELTWV